MILDYMETEFDGNSWEDLCDACYRMRYQDQNFQKVPARYKGDCGIEGYTQNGIVYQCYYPDGTYSDNELHEHYRDKMTTDLNRLCDSKNGEQIVAIGVPTIKEWHFVVPFYRDKRILEHAEAKRANIANAIQAFPDKHTHLDQGFRIIIKVADDFKIEISRIIRQTLVDFKINLVTRDAEAISWDDCPSEKVENIKRKIAAVMNPSPSHQVKYEKVVDIYIQYYMRGIEKLGVLQDKFPDIYEQIYSLEQGCKQEAEIQTNMNGDTERNLTLFNEILKDFEEHLHRDFSDYFLETSIIELKNNMVAAWLADCPMDFSRD